MLKSSYGRASIDDDFFPSLLSSCDVPASSYPYMDPATTTTTTATATGTVTTTAAASATCTGPTYTVQSGDACQSIGVANGIATEVFISDNGLDYNCTTLILGEEVCLGDSCDLYQVQTNNTCDAIFGR